MLTNLYADVMLACARFCNRRMRQYIDFQDEQSKARFWFWYEWDDWFISKAMRARSPLR